MAKIRSTVKLISISTGNSDATKNGIGAMPVLWSREHFLTPESFSSIGSSDATTGYSDGTIFQLQNSSERPNGSFKLLVTGRTDALTPEVPMPTQKCAQRLQTASSSVWPIYMCSSGHFEFAGVARVPRHHIHIQEHIQAIQEHKDHMLRFKH